jgi:ubiquitin carboxyl-terminal hydrolase L5
MSWCTIESDPGVFSELISKLGVPGIDVEEVYGLEDLLVNDDVGASAQVGELKLDATQKFGLIFLFKYSGDIKDERPTIPFDDNSSLYFAKQIVQDACATQAILSVLLNSNVELGSNLTDFKCFTQCLDYEMRGLSIGNSNHIRGMIILTAIVPFGFDWCLCSTFYHMLHVICRCAQHVRSPGALHAGEVHHQE